MVVSFNRKNSQQFCEQEGVLQQLTTPYTPEQNGVAERKNRTVVELARSMMKSKGLPNWAEAVATAVYLLNLSPTKAVMNRTPFEAWFERKPGVGHSQVFGCIAYTCDCFKDKFGRKENMRSASLWGIAHNLRREATLRSAKKK